MRFLRVLYCLSFVIASCSESINRDISTGAGAVVGGGVGAAIGDQLGNSVVGIAVGAITGGLIGGVVGHEADVSKLNVKGQEETILKQEKELLRQRRDIEDIQRQQYHDKRFKELTSKPLQNNYGNSNMGGEQPITENDNYIPYYSGDR